MNCTVCQDLLQQHLDGLESADPAGLEGHLHDCPSCRALHAGALRFQQGVRLLTPPCLPDGLAGRIVTRLRDDYRSRQRWRRRLTLGVAVAAAVLVLVSTRLWWPGGTPVEVVPPPPGPVANGTTSKPPAVEPGAVRESMSEVGSAMYEVAARTADVTVAESRPFLPRLSGPALGPLQLPSSPSAPGQVLREAGEGVSGSLGPVADSPRRALDLFLRELPPMNLDQKMGL